LGEPIVIARLDPAIHRNKTAGESLPFFVAGERVNCRTFSMVAASSRPRKNVPLGMRISQFPHGDKRGNAARRER